MIQPVKRAFEMLEGVCQFDAPLKLVAITPSEQFNLIYPKVPLLAAVFVASPWLVYQAWGFIAPGLYQRERGWARPFILCIAGLFVLGGLFGYFVVLRFALAFLIGIGCEIDIQPMITISSYFSTFVMVERPQPADLLVDRQQLSAQLLEAMKGGHFPLRLASFRLIGKRLGNRLPVHTMSETVLGTVTRILGPGAMTVGLATAARKGRHRPAAHIPEGRALQEQTVAIRFQL